MKAQSIISPESSSGSFLYSIFVHGLIALSVVALLKMNLQTKQVPSESLIDMTYETFDRPPEKTQEVRHIAKVVEPEIPQEAKPTLHRSRRQSFS